MAYKTITTIITSTDGLEALIDNAVRVARMCEAHLDVICLGLDRTQPGFYYAGANAMVFQDNLAQARDVSVELEATARAALETEEIPWSVTGLTAQMVAMSGLIAHRTRFSDLVVLPRPYGENCGHECEAVVEAALFDAGTPVLILPDSYTIPEDIENVILAWNESAEALRATRAALPFLRAAEVVNITIIDPPQHGPERSDPGGALSQMLSRHGVRADVSVLAKTMPRVSDILNRQARDKDAQLVVMGAYGHSRFRESIMGGATRHMLEVAEVPVLMTH
jgi:nucleotide-binding universal stress UspA family protein